MANINEKPKLLSNLYQATLLDGAELASPWIDASEVDKIIFAGRSSVAGMVMTIESRAVGTAQTPLITDTEYSDGSFFLFNVPPRQSEILFRWKNDTGVTATEVSMEVKASYGGSDKLSVFPIGVQPSDFSQAALVQAITRGKTPAGVYEAVGVNQAGAMLNSDFGSEVARGLYPSYSISTKFGRNSDIGTATYPQDIWGGGGDYTGHNPTANENLDVFSASANDTGSLVSSGTATGGTDTTLTDSGATFVSDGVAIGDLLINDGCGCHGYIVSVDSETQVTVFDMHNGIMTTNTTGDAYRIATSTGSGAAVIVVMASLDADFNKNNDVYIILNGLTSVVTAGDFYRVNKAKVILAGSSGVNEGGITIRQSVTTANIFAVMPTTGQTDIAAFTVPKGKTMEIKRIRVGIVRNNGSAGSAQIILFAREYLGAWNGIRNYDIQDGGGVSYTYEGGNILFEGTDVKYRCVYVSDNGTAVDAEFEYYLIDNE